MSNDEKTYDASAQLWDALTLLNLVCMARLRRESLVGARAVEVVDRLQGGSRRSIRHAAEIFGVRILKGEPVQVIDELRARALFEECAEVCRREVEDAAG